MNEKILLPELAELLAKEAKCSKRTAELFLKEFFSLAEEIVTSGETLKINGLGTFKPIWVAPRESINVQTGEPFLIPGHYKLSFLPDKKLRDAVNAPFACFDTVVLDAEGHEVRENLPDGNESEEENEEERIDDIEETPVPEEISQIFSNQEVDVQNAALPDIKEKPASVSSFTESLPEQPTEKSPENTGNHLIVEQEDVIITGFIERDRTFSEVREESGSFSASAGVREEPVISGESFSDISGSGTDFTVKPEADAGFSANITFSKPEPCDSHPIESPEIEATDEFLSVEREVHTPGDRISPVCTPSYTSHTTGPLPVKVAHVPEEIEQLSGPVGEGKDPLHLPEGGDVKIRRKGVKYTLIGGFMLLFFIGIYIFRSLRTAGNTRMPLYTEFQEEKPIVTAPAATEKEPLTGASGREDPVSVVTTVLPEKTPDPVPVRTVTPVTPVTEEIRPGLFMTKIALKHYGNKSFWVYIYEENKDRIKNPNKIPVGTRLIIPDKSKYGIDAGNAESVEKAKKKAEELKRRFD